MLSSFTTAPTREDINSSSALGDRIVRSFQNQSADEFITLLPTLDEFHELMENNLEIYGSSLEEAKKDFSIEYNEHIVGAAKGSFTEVLNEGANRGIDWTGISFVKAEADGQATSFSSELTITFRSGAKEYKFRLRPAIVIDNQWRVTQNLELL